MLSLALAALLAAPAAGTMGSINFPVTGSSRCQSGFIEGMLSLHSFMYDRAHSQFQQTAKADPNCAMAFWGDAMAYYHPLWSEENPVAAKEALDKVKNEEKLSVKERAYLKTARALWSESDASTRRDAWLQASERMYRDFPDDNETRLQYALALIASGGRQDNVKRLMQAAALSMEVMQNNPQHPGAAHYLIHASDSPDHAVLALPAARRYAQIAPAASHALHMPSHIFVQLGKYADVAASNRASWAASQVEYKELAKSPDERDWHSYSWLVDAYVNLGEIKRAKQMVQDMQQMLVKNDGPETRFGYVTILSSYMLGTGRWDELDELGTPLSKPLPLEAGESPDSAGCALHAPGSAGARPPFGLTAGVLFAQLQAQARSLAGDEEGVKSALKSADKWLAGMAPWDKSDGTRTLRLRHQKLSTALLAAAKARKSPSDAAWAQAIDAYTALASVADLYVSGPSFFASPAEMLGNILMSAEKSKEALASFERSLVMRPSVGRVLIQAARAAKASGADAKAQEYYKVLADQWAKGDADWDELKEAKTALKLSAKMEIR